MAVVVVVGWDRKEGRRDTSTSTSTCNATIPNSHVLGLAAGGNEQRP